MDKIKVIIVDDNKILNDIMRKKLEVYDDVEVLGSCYSDEEEISMIDRLKPEVVITDLIRNGTPSGLEIIKRYKEKSNMPKFLAITAGGDELINSNTIDGLVKKPFIDYGLIINGLRNIKAQIDYEKLPKKINDYDMDSISVKFHKVIEKIKSCTNIKK